MRQGSKSETVASSIDAEIKRLKLKPGTPLGTKSSLGERFSVSPGTLNEALRLLQSADSIVLRPGPRGGVFVGTSGPPLRLRNIIVSTAGAEVELANLVAVRDELEVLVALEATRNCTPAQVEQFRAQLEVIAGLPKGRDETLEIWRLHKMIAASGGNTFLTKVYTEALEAIEELVTDFEVSTSPTPGVKSDAVEVHGALVEAIASGDQNEARLAAIAHNPLSRNAT